MHAYEIRDGFGLDHLAVVGRPTPEPGPGEVRVRVRAVSLNYRDLMVVKGQYNPKMKLPRVPCSDGAGVVEAAGAGVSRVKTGDRVTGAFMPAWVEGDVTEAKAKSALGGGVDGLLAEQVVLPDEGVVPVPSHLSDEEAATLPCAAVTAWHALVHAARVKAGDRVLIQGTGGVSLFALQFARLLGARVVGTSSSDAKLERARALGLWEGINYRTTPEWGDRVRELTGNGVDQVIEVGGAGTLGQSLRAVRMGGTVCLIGVLSGGGAFDPRPVLMKNVRVQGIYVGSRVMFEAMNRAITLHQLRPVIDKVFPFAQTADAFRHMESGTHFGKIVIKL